MRELDVLMVIEGEIATTQLIERVLNACGVFGIRYRKRLLKYLRAKDFQRTTIPLFVRCGDPLVEIWVELLHRCKHPYIYYIDDNFWRIEGDSPLARYYRNPVIRKSLEYTVSGAACILTNSHELSTFLGRFNPQTTVLPAFFDFSLIEDVVPRAEGEVRIGFAGSPSRGDDLEIIAPLIHPILKAHPDVAFEFAGIMPRGVACGDRVRFFSHTSDYKGFIRFQAERAWAVGLAPLVDNESNRCKTNNKYREYGACRIAGIYSDLPPYGRSVIPDVTGILVNNTNEAWLSALNRLLSDQQARTEIGNYAYNDVSKKHRVENVAGEWASSIAKVGDAISMNCSRPSMSATAQWLRAKQLAAKCKTLQMRIAARYEEGGLSLVLRKSLDKLAKNRVRSE